MEDIMMWPSGIKEEVTQKLQKKPIVNEYKKTSSFIKEVK